MKKVIASIAGVGLVIALGVTTVGAQNLTTTPPIKTEKTFDVACVQAAVDKRETSLIAVADTANASIKAALETRKTELKSAWAVTVAKDRQTARKGAWDKYSAAAKATKQALLTSRKSAGTTFKTDMKACGTAVAAVAASEANVISAEQ